MPRRRLGCPVGRAECIKDGRDTKLRRRRKGQRGGNKKRQEAYSSFKPLGCRNRTGIRPRAKRDWNDRRWMAPRPGNWLSNTRQWPLGAAGYSTSRIVTIRPKSYNQDGKRAGYQSNNKPSRWQQSVMKRSSETPSDCTKRHFFCCNDFLACRWTVINGSVCKDGGTKSKQQNHVSDDPEGNWRRTIRSSSSTTGDES